MDDTALVGAGSRGAQGMEILDISMNGIAFKYKEDNDLLKDSDTVDIKAENIVRLSNLQYKVISDTELVEIHGIKGKMRRRSLQFRNLTEEQKQNLSYFIENYKSGKA